MKRLKFSKRQITGSESQADQKLKVLSSGHHSHVTEQSTALYQIILEKENKSRQ